MPIENGQLVLRTLGEYLEGHELSAVCRECARTVDLDGGELLRFGPDVDADEIKRRVRCRECGRRTGRLLVGVAGTSGTGR